VDFPKNSEMKKRYDFSKGERGKFCSENKELYMPVYLDKETRKFIEELSTKTSKDPNTIVNELLKKDKLIIDYARD
jgi:hypothetical protein